MPDGTVETKNVTGVSRAVVSVDSAFSTTPNVNTLLYKIQQLLHKNLG